MTCMHLLTRRFPLRAFHLAAWFVCLAPAHASDVDEFKIKREDVFAFAKAPSVTREGDRITVNFEAKGFCDVTVAVEDPAGKIVRHLASGVLGRNAPSPFAKDAKAQTLVWDGKDDQGRYVDDKENHSIRVSLGLKPQFERTLFWRPKLRQKRGNPLLAAAPEGVYVFEGIGVDHLRLFSHDGEYLRTIYPFPADKLDAVQGLKLIDRPQDGGKLPFKVGFMTQTLLTSGTSSITDESYSVPMNGSAGTALAAHGDRIALAMSKLDRIATDGSSSGLPLTGGQTFFPAKHLGVGGHRGRDIEAAPTSVAFSPDGKTVYLAGYVWRMMGHWDCLHGVAKIDYEKDGAATVFAGSIKQDELGNGDDRFNCPSSVDVDAQGRVYVSDFMNDRIQIFSPDAKLLKSVPLPRPAQLSVHRKTGELYVFTWPVYTRALMGSKRKFDSKLTILEPFESLKKKAEYPLPINGYGGHHDEWWGIEGLENFAAVDAWAEPTTIWLAKQGVRQKSAYLPEFRDASWSKLGIQLFSLEGGKLKPKRNFSEDLAKSSVRSEPPDFAKQRLYVNPKNQKLYVGEDLGYAKSFKEMVEIDPDTGQEKLVELPFDAEDIAFDMNGMAYLRTDTIVARYDPRTWREIPWDYGEERQGHGHASGSDGKRANLIGGLALPGQRPVCWNQGGLYVSPKGHMAVSVASRAKAVKRTEDASLTWRKQDSGVVEGKQYSPPVFPGRMRWQEVHVWDKHGQVVHEDAIPGSHILEGVGIDNEDNLYVLTAATRLLDGKLYFNEMAGTVAKFRPKQCKVIGSSDRCDVPVQAADQPKEPQALRSSALGHAWVQGAQWFYGGIGFAGFNSTRAGGGCACWSMRFTLDYFARSFAPETDHFSIAVLDSAGNLILRVGRYGNVEDGKPLVAGSGPAGARSIGGDEVSLFHAAFVGTHTDRRLFIADAGNNRLLSVKLGYHAEERVALKDVPDAAK